MNHTKKTKHIVMMLRRMTVIMITIMIIVAIANMTHTHIRNSTTHIQNSTNGL